MNKLSLESALRILLRDEMRQYKKLNTILKEHITEVKKENKKKTRGFTLVTSINPFRRRPNVSVSEVDTKK